MWRLSDSTGPAVQRTRPPPARVWSSGSLVSDRDPAGPKVLQEHGCLGPAASRAAMLPRVPQTRAGGGRKEGRKEGRKGVGMILGGEGQREAPVCVCVRVSVRALNRCHPPHPIPTPNTPVEFGFAHRGKSNRAALL